MPQPITQSKTRQPAIYSREKRDYAKKANVFDAVIKTPLPEPVSKIGINICSPLSGTNGGDEIQAGHLTGLTFVSEQIPEKMPVRDSYAVEVIKQLNAYFMDPHFRFQLSLMPQGTAYQKRVWKALCNCPAGTLWTYGEFAASIGSSARAIGGACRRNPIPIIVPCHRVTARDGLGGYAGHVSGHYMKIKKWLLCHEAAI